MDLEDVWEVVSWTYLAQEGQWCTLLSVVMNLLRPKKCGEFTDQSSDYMFINNYSAECSQLEKQSTLNNKASILNGSQLQ